MRAGTWVGVVLMAVLGAGCEEDWSGRYEGDGHFDWSRRVMAGPPDANGAGMADTSQGNGSGGGVTVRRVDAQHYVLVTPYCELHTEQQPDPNVHNGQVTSGQTCTVPVGDQEMPMEVSGSLMFGRDNPTLHLDFHGEARRDANEVPDGDFSMFSWTFDGQRPAE